MTFSEHAETFFGRAIESYEPKLGVQDATRAQRLALTWDEHDQKARLSDRVAALAADPKAKSIAAIMIGPWTYDMGLTSETIIQELSANAASFPNLRALFLGDIISEEWEVSWIENHDITPLLTAYPALELLKVRGGQGLTLQPLRHDGLRELVVEAGGLPDRVVKAIAGCTFPALERLELWLGTDEYEGTTAGLDIKQLLESAGFPKLRYLGLRNSELGAFLTAAVATGSLVQQLEELDLSLGTLEDEHLAPLEQRTSWGKLKRLDVSNNYLSDAAIAKLRKTAPVFSNVQREGDEYNGTVYRYVWLSE